MPALSSNQRVARWKARALRAEQTSGMLQNRLKEIFDQKIYAELQVIHDIRNHLMPLFRQQAATLADMKRLYEMLIVDKKD